MSGIFIKKTESFWEWLALNTGRIQNCSRQDFNQVNEEIHKAYAKSFPDLVWEITPVPAAPWLFCVSADGNPELFPKVQKTIQEAPKIPGWIIQGFRQRGSLELVLDMKGCKLGYEDVWCSVAREDGGFCLTLWIRGLSQQNVEALSRGALILLDNAVGEYDAVVRIKRLDRGPLPANPERKPDFFPLRDLPQFFDGANAS